MFIFGIGETRGSANFWSLSSLRIWKISIAVSRNKDNETWLYFRTYVRICVLFGGGVGAVHSLLEQVRVQTSGYAISSE